VNFGDSFFGFAVSCLDKDGLNNLIEKKDTLKIRQTISKIMSSNISFLNTP
jgi:hypothetical protein